MIAKWIIVGMFALSILILISTIGKPRKPLEPSTAAVVTAINAAYIVAIILWWKS